jgi:hypothetical protein
MAPMLSFSAPRLAALPFVAALALAPLAVTPAAAQEVSGRGDSAFVWTGRIPSGAHLTVRARHGTVEVGAAAGETAEVRAVKRGRGRDTDVAFRVVREGNDVVICVVEEDEDDCDADGSRRERRSSRGEPATDFTVRLPRGVHVAAMSGNGEVTVRGATADVEAHSGNGEVRVGGGAREVEATSGNGEVEVEEARGPVTARSGNGDVRVATAVGPVSATTGNGQVTARMTTLPESGDMEFRTGNGEVRIEVPAGFTAVIDASMGHGQFSSDFAITLEGRFSPQRLRGTIGSGGRRVRLSSGNGDIEIRKVGQ